MTDDLKERLREIFDNVDARPKRRQGITAMTIDAQMRGTICQINEYEMDVLRDAISYLEARLAAAEAGEDALAGLVDRAVTRIHRGEYPELFRDMGAALDAYEARRKG